MTCPACKAQFKPAAKCPSCGTELHHQKQRALEVYEARLQEIQRKQELSENKFGLPKTEVYAQLRGYAEQRGYADGWAAHSYREIYGNWPRTKPEPVEPGKAVAGWCKHKLIKHAKRRQAA
jgi:hypothetical protein